MSLLGIALLSTLVIFSLSVFYFVNRTEGKHGAAVNRKPPEMPPGP